MEHMATSRTRKPARKTAKPASGKARVTKKAAARGRRQAATKPPAATRKAVATRKPSSAKPSGKSASARPARAPVRVAGAPTGAARTAARRVPAYITRPRDAEAGWAAPAFSRGAHAHPQAAQTACAQAQGDQSRTGRGQPESAAGSQETQGTRGAELARPGRLTVAPDARQWRNQA